jgi:hypothetical protein
MRSWRPAIVLLPRFQRNGALLAVRGGGGVVGACWRCGGGSSLLEVWWFAQIVGVDGGWLLVFWLSVTTHRSQTCKRLVTISRTS